MISRELAEKLKAAGLPWEPKIGDMFVGWEGPNERDDGHYIDAPMRFDEYFGIVCDTKPEDIWLPTLSDLLHEIEARGYEWSMECFRYLDDSGHWLFRYEIVLQSAVMSGPRFSEDAPDEAAGETLLWVLEREGKDNV